MTESIHQQMRRKAAQPNPFNDREISGSEVEARDAAILAERAASPKTILLNAAKSLVGDIEKGDIVTAAWASRRVEELITDPDTLAAYGFKLDSSDIMRPRLVEIEDEHGPGASAAAVEREKREAADDWHRDHDRSSRPAKLRSGTDEELRAAHLAHTAQYGLPVTDIEA